MTTYHKILSADKTELRRIAIQTAELNQKMYAMLEAIYVTGMQPTESKLKKLLAEARGEEL